MTVNIISLARRASSHVAIAAALACGIALTTTTTAIADEIVGERMTKVAQDPIGERLTKVVSFADLDINSEHGAKVLYGRVRGAAKQVCAPLDARGLAQTLRWRACFHGAIERAVEDIDHPMLTAYYLNSNDKALAPVRVAKSQ